MHVGAGQSLCVDGRTCRLWQSGDFNGLLRLRLTLGGGRRRGVRLDEFPGLGRESGVRTSVFSFILLYEQRKKQDKRIRLNMLNKNVKKQILAETQLVRPVLDYYYCCFFFVHFNQFHKQNIYCATEWSVFHFKCRVLISTMCVKSPAEIKHGSRCSSENTPNVPSKVCSLGTYQATVF